jgi:hypothetical protein
MCFRLACGELVSEWTTWKDFEMLRHSHKLEVLLGDLECRYGIDHAVSLDIRAALPKVSKPHSGASNAIPLGQKYNAPTRIKNDSTTPV